LFIATRFIPRWLGIWGLASVVLAGDGERDEVGTAAAVSTAGPGRHRRPRRWDDPRSPGLKGLDSARSHLHKVRPA
jgi:hypothetical protein